MKLERLFYLPIIIVLCAAALCNADPNRIQGTGKIQPRKPWDKEIGPFYEFVFDPPLHNIHTDQANAEPDQDVVRWALCGDGAEFKKNVGKKVSITAVPTPSYAETLCLKIVRIVDLREH
jgi:hypothetical protein